MKKYILILLAVVCMLLFGCGQKTDEPEISGDDQPQQTLPPGDQVFALNCSFSSPMNPYTTDNALNLVVGELVYEHLVELDDTFQPHPGLFKSWSSEDGITWVFQAELGRKFHDGHELTADDIIYSINSAKESQRYAGRLRNITEVTAGEDGSIVVKLNRANTQFPVLLTIPVIENNAMGYNYPSGTGPYCFSEDHTCLWAFGDHPERKNMPVDAIVLLEYSSMEDVINAFDNSDLDLVCNDPTSSGDLSFSSVSESRQYNTTNLQYIGFNTDSRFFSNPEHRAAMVPAVDRSYAVSLLKDNAVAATAPIHPASPLFEAAMTVTTGYDLNMTASALTNAKVLDYDGDGEREYLAYEGSTEATDLDLTLLVCSDNKQKTSVCNKLASDLRQIGVPVTIKALPWEEYLEALEKGEFDMYYGEVRLTADFDLTPLLVYGGSVNYGNVTNPIYAEAINAYLAADDEHRAEACSAMLQVVSENLPILPVCFEKHEVCAHRGVVGGLTPTQDNIFYKLSDWIINIG